MDAYTSPLKQVVGVIASGNQDIETLNEYNVADKLTAQISATERAKCIPENIAQGVTLLGVTGTHSGGGGGGDISTATLTLLDQRSNPRYIPVVIPMCLELDNNEGIVTIWFDPPAGSYLMPLYKNQVGFELADTSASFYTQGNISYDSDNAYFTMTGDATIVFNDGMT